jgi:two-component system invasion response regulator UvrY
MIRLLLADDHPIVREGLKFVVSQNRDIEIVGEAEDGEATLNLCKRTPADVLLLDVSMPGPGILDLIRTLRASRPQLRLLVLSVHPEQHYARRVLKAGADGYLTKNHSSSALADAIRQVYHGHKYVTPSLAEELAVDLSTGRPDSGHESLSNREYEVFLLLGAGKRVDEVARRLGLSSKTVWTYRSRIIEKMNFRSTAEIIFYAVRHGLVTEISSAAPHMSENTDDSRRVRSSKASVAKRRRTERRR